VQNGIALSNSFHQEAPPSRRVEPFAALWRSGSASKQMDLSMRAGAYEAICRSATPTTSIFMFEFYTTATTTYGYPA
jgi:hypothetical protein